MITLYHSPRACSLAALSLLNHVELPFALELVDVRKSEHRQNWFLALNPLGQVPVLVDGDFVLTQLGAILGYIARQAGAGRLAELTNRERAEQERWMYYLASVVHVQFAGVWRPERFSDEERSYDRMRTTALRQLGASFAKCEADLGTRAWLLGDTLSLADFNFFPLLSWVPRVLPSGLAEFPRLSEYLDRLLELPAVQGALLESGVDRGSLLAA